MEQVAFADRLMLNKVDLVTEDAARRVARLKSINDGALERASRLNAVADSARLPTSAPASELALRSFDSRACEGTSARSIAHSPSTADDLDPDVPRSNIKGFDLKRTLEMDPEFLNTDGEHEHDRPSDLEHHPATATSTSTELVSVRCAHVGRPPAAVGV